MIVLRRNPWLSLTSLALVTLALAACQTVPPPRFTAEQVALFKNEGFVLVDEDWELDLSGRFLFDIDEDRLGDEGNQAVRALTRALLDVGIDRVRLDGHTDNTGRSDYNQQLSLRRATKVAAEMVDSGMQSSLVEIRGLGDSMPISLEHTSEGRRQNRRVVLVVSAR